MRNLRRHFSYANLTSTLALVIALGMGSAYAAEQLAPKSVGAKQLRPGAVTAKKIRKQAVTAPKLQAGAVKQGKIGPGAVTAEKIAAGAISPDKLPGGVIGTEKIAGNAVTGEKVDEGSLGTVPSAQSAAFAATAGAANPEAFAKVNGEGTVFPGDSKGIGTVDVKQGNTPGIYCVRPPFAPKGAQVTPEYTNTGDVAVFVKFGGTASCGPAEVEVRHFNGVSLGQGPFYIVLYR